MIGLRGEKTQNRPGGVEDHEESIYRRFEPQTSVDDGRKLSGVTRTLRLRLPLEPRLPCSGHENLSTLQQFAPQAKQVIILPKTARVETLELRRIFFFAVFD